ncbi:hypothetical protein KDL45_18265, partial [bacterium]|nr:hypothetical protein [bacterium]
AAGPVVYLLALGAVFRYRQLADTSAVHDRLMRTAFVHWAASALLYAFLYLFKNRAQVEYFQSFVGFGAVLAASYFSHRWTEGERRGRVTSRARNAAAFAVIALLLLGTNLMMAYRIMNTCSYKLMFRADDWDLIAERTAEFIRERDLKDVSVRQRTYGANAEGELISSIYGSHVPTALLLLKNPDFYSRLVRNDAVTPQMYIRIVPGPLRGRAEGVLPGEFEDPRAVT